MNLNDPQGELLRPESNSPTSPTETQALQRAFQTCQNELLGLRKLFVAALVALIAMGLGLNAFMYKQTSLVKYQLGEIQPQILEYSAKYREKEPMVRSFLTQLSTFAQANRDFQPILMKYRTALSSYFPATATSSPASPSPTTAR